MTFTQLKIGALVEVNGTLGEVTSVGIASYAITWETGVTQRFAMLFDTMTAQGLFLS